MAVCTAGIPVHCAESHRGESSKGLCLQGVVLHGMKRDCEEGILHYFASIVDDCSVFLENQFGLFIKITGNFMYLVFLTTLCTPHANPAAHAVYNKLS